MLDDVLTFFDGIPKSLSDYHSDFESLFSFSILTLKYSMQNADSKRPCGSELKHCLEKKTISYIHSVCSSLPVYAAFAFQISLLYYAGSKRLKFIDI